MTDFLFANHGSITILTPLTEAASEWLDANLPDDLTLWGTGAAIEPRYVGPILEGIVADGLTVGA